MSIRPLALALILGLLSGCAAEPKLTMDRDTMTQRQKDSVLGTTKIPGASNIPRAQRAADSLSARSRALDTLQ